MARSKRYTPLADPQRRGWFKVLTDDHERL